MSECECIGIGIYNRSPMSLLCTTMWVIIIEERHNSQELRTLIGVITKFGNLKTGCNNIPRHICMSRTMFPKVIDFDRSDMSKSFPQGHIL